MTECSSPMPRSGWEVFDSTSIQNQESSARKEDDGSPRQNSGKMAFSQSSPEKINGGNAQDYNDVYNNKITSLFQATHADTNADVNFRPGSAMTSISSLQDNSPAATPKTPDKNELRADGVILTAIFAIDKISYDVDLYDDRIVWNPVTPGKPKKSSRTELQQDLPIVDRGMIYIHDICSVRLKNIKSMKSGNVTTIGFALFTAQQKSGNKLREQSLLFLCFSREICIQWASRIKAVINARAECPKRLLIVATDSIQARMMWNDSIESQLQMACIKGKLVEIHKSNSVTEYVQQILAEQSISRDPESFDGILVLGKIGFFSEVMNAVLQFKKEVLRTGTWHPRIPTLGFIPTSNSSYIASEMHGCSDVETAVFHAVYGCTRSVPISTYYDKDGNYLKHGIIASYGFSGGDTTSESSSNGFGAIQGSIKRGFAFTKAIVQRRSYSCEIRYKDSPQGFEPFSEDELFEDDEFNKYSIVNQFYVEDDNETGHSRLNTPPSSNHPTPDSDSGVWPQIDKWDTVPQRNYLDITVTSLPQHDDKFVDGCQLSAILVRETMSRKDLFMGMGSQISISSVISQKNKPETENKTDVLRGSEFIIQPNDLSSTSNSSNLSRWTIDGNCLDPNIQELHVQVDELPLIMYGRVPGQPLCMRQGEQTMIRLDTTPENVTLDSMA